MGGIETIDGKSIRWGKVFRSDDLNKLTARDYSRLNAIGISLVCDLRSPEERTKYPTRWQHGSPDFVLAQIGSAEDDRLTHEALDPGDLSLERRKSAFERSYVLATFESARALERALRAIESSERPVVFHCVAGRDRSGIMAAILLRILGVSNSAIVSDYLLSTRYLEEDRTPTPIPSDAKQAKEARAVAEVVRLQPRYIEAVFKAIDQRYGNFDSYRRKALHLTDADVASLKARVLE